MSRKTLIMSLCLVSMPVASSMAQPKPQEQSRTAVLETRLVRDSAGCLTAVDLWLVSTTDTIQGFEVVLQWDRPDRIHFVRGTKSSPKPKTAADSLTAMLAPSDPSTQIPVDRAGSIVSKWEFVEARTLNSHSAKIMGVAKLFGQEDPAPVLPGMSGSLLRLPVSVQPAKTGIADSASITLSFDTAGTRLSTHRGVLFGPLALKQSRLAAVSCESKTK